MKRPIQDKVEKLKSRLKDPLTDHNEKLEIAKLLNDDFALHIIANQDIDGFVEKLDELIDKMEIRD